MTVEDFGMVCMGVLMIGIAFLLIALGYALLTGGLQ